MIDNVPIGEFNFIQLVKMKTIDRYNTKIMSASWFRQIPGTNMKNTDN